MQDPEQLWSRYWQDEGAGGEVFVDPSGGRHPALGTHWQSVFDSLADGASIIDIASGAGSIFAHLPSSHGFALTAADLSPKALEVLSGRFEGVHTLVCPADAVPSPDQSFDLVVSQFGIEYAGVGAFAEAARLVAPGGSFRALVHIEDGYLDAPNQQKLAEAQLASDSHFIDHAIELINAVFAADATAIEHAEAAFEPASRALAEALQRCPEGVHAHLLLGFRQLYERRAHYLAGDITGWLEAMRGEVDKAVLRLGEMRRAAMSAKDVEEIATGLREAGLKSITIEHFFAPQHSRPLAWDIRARRSNQSPQAGDQ